MNTANAGDKKVRWGIIGAGRIAKSAMAPAIKAAEEAELLAVASRTEERGQALAREMGAPRGYGSYEALIADPDVEAVYLGLPNGLHEQWAVAAAQAGKHVLSDKSLTFSRASASRMREACRQAGVLLMEGFMYRHHPQWRVVRDLMKEGRLGQLRHIQGTFGGLLEDATDHRWSPTLGKGCLYDITCYPINAARYLTGEEPSKVAACAEWVEQDVDRTTQVSMLFPSGVMATAFGSFGCHVRQRVVLMGSLGWIEVERPWGPGTEPARITVASGSETDVIEVPGANQFAEQIRHFSRCLRKGELTYPAEDGLRNTMVLEAAARAASEGIVVAL